MYKDNVELVKITQQLANDQAAVIRLNTQAMTRLVDRIDGAMPSVWVLSLPMWVWRLAMLAWALWLAMRIIRWARFGWACFGEGGLWKRIARRPAPQPAPDPAPGPEVGGGDEDAEGGPPAEPEG